MQKISFSTENVHCANCSGRVEKILNALSNVDSVRVNVLRKTMEVTFHEENTSKNVISILDTMKDAGYGAALLQEPPVKKSPVLQEIIPVHALTHHKAPANPSTSKTKAEHTPHTIHELPKPLLPLLRLTAFIFELPNPLLRSLLLSALIMYVAMGPLPAPMAQWLRVDSALLCALLQALLCAPVLYIHRSMFFSGWRALKGGSPNMDSLVGLGSGAAILFGVYALVRMFFAEMATPPDAVTVQHWAHNLYFDAAAMIVALIGLGKHFEDKARGRAANAIDSLMRLAPTKAVRLERGKEVTIATSSIEQGDTLVVHAGHSIAVDGIVIMGTAFVDESFLTGESAPVEKHEGDTVIGATVSTSGFFHMRVTGIGEETTLAKIVRLVDEAMTSKAPIARLADRISAIFVPVIIGISFVTCLVWLVLGYSIEFAMARAIAVLVISCPCALGLATPTAIMVGAGIGAEKGILFKSAAALERLSTVDTVVLDKTGTLTHGKAVVTDILPCAHTTEEQVLHFAASVERLSGHPLGQAIVREAHERNVALLPSEHFTELKEIPGLGLAAVVRSEESGDTNGTEQRVLAGNVRLLAAEGIVHTHDTGLDDETLASAGKTVLYFVQDGIIQGRIAVADAVRKSSATAVQNLRTHGLTVLMLTGDSATTARAVQHSVGVDQVFAEVRPDEKESKIRHLQNAGHSVVMVGDGINDAPALARADVGMAIGAGTDIAMKTSDVVLMHSDVAHVEKAYRLSKAVMRTIKQNLFWAFAYNIVLIPVAAGLFYVPWHISLNPMLAAASMSLSSLTVVGNALRLRQSRKKVFQ